MKTVYDVQDVINAGCTLEPIKCRNCDSLEVTFNQAMQDALCANCGEWQLEIGKIQSYPETHQHGLIEITEPLIPKLGNNRIGDFGIQIAEDGRIWICIDGQSVIRFKPLTKDQLELIKKGD